MSRAIHRAKHIMLALLLAAIGITAHAVSTTSHYDAADAVYLKCSHANQSIHELSSPPAHWPGTRAAHTVWASPGGFKNQNVYTKSSILDPTWDFYYTSYISC